MDSVSIVHGVCFEDCSSANNSTSWGGWRGGGRWEQTLPDEDYNGNGVEDVYYLGLQ